MLLKLLVSGCRHGHTDIEKDCMYEYVQFEAVSFTLDMLS